TLWTRVAARRYLVAFATAAAVWIVAMVLRHFSSAAGPGTSTADLSTLLAAHNLWQIAERPSLDSARSNNRGTVSRAPLSLPAGHRRGRRADLHGPLAGALRPRAAAADR